MPFIAIVETTDDNRGRFLAATAEEAIAELGRHFPVGSTVADRLQKGERIVTDAYTLALLPLEAEPPRKQQTFAFE